MSSGEEAGDTLAEQLAEVPFEDLQRLRSQGQGPLGSSFSRHKVAAAAAAASKAAGGKPPAVATERNRANKNRPMEMSSKKPVPRLREVIQVPKAAVRDPRFETICGDFDESRFKKSYGFLYHETLPKEAERLRKALKKERDSNHKAQLKHRLVEVEGLMKVEEQRKRRESKDTDLRHHQKELVESGKTPFFVSKSKRKREQLVEKFKELKAQGKLEAFLAKRRKKNASKEHKQIPATRR